MRRALAVVAVALTALGFGPRLFASATQLAVTPASITPTMVASLTAQLSLALTNGGTAGQADRGDRLVVTFPRALDASTICSTWSASPTNTQTISSNWAIVVTITDGGAGNDVLTVASPGACGGGVDLGTVDLGSTDFTSGGDHTFAGNGNGGRTTLAYDPNALQLTVTFGTRGGTGTATTVGPVTATYTPSGTLLYGDGSSVAPAIGTTTGAAL
jgi:hypothetical protein